jgi:hypothetical protein
MFGFDLLENVQLQSKIFFESHKGGQQGKKLNMFEQDLNAEDLNLDFSGEMDTSITVRDDLACLNKFVISKGSTWKGVFDLIMMITSVYNIFANAQYAAFGNPDSLIEKITDYFVEGLFLCDMIFCFFQEYMDEETYKVVRNFKQIAKHYAKKSFIFDLMAWFPIEMILTGGAGIDIGDKARLFRVLRLLRIPRLA